MGGSPPTLWPQLAAKEDRVVSDRYITPRASLGFFDGFIVALLAEAAAILAIWVVLRFL